MELLCLLTRFKVTIKWGVLEVFILLRFRLTVASSGPETITAATD